MFFIYKITNLINQKIYIGSSSIDRGYDTRWEEHKKASKLEKHPCYNYPLQKAMRKYGIDNFEYQIIETDIPTADKRAELEQQYIIYYNSLTNTGYGYNQTLFTECALADPKIKKQMCATKAKRVALVDKQENIIQIFESVHDAAEYSGNRNSAGNITRICNGESRSINGYIFRWVNDDNKVVIPQIFQTRPRRCEICGINIKNPNEIKYFESVLAASQELKIDRASIQRCLAGNKKYSNVGGYIFRKLDDNNNIIDNNISIEEICQKYITLSNNKTLTFTEWCNELQVARQSVYAKIKKEKITKQKALEYYLQKRR